MSRVLTTPLYDRCEFTHFTDEDMEAQGRGKATPKPMKQGAQTQSWVILTQTASLGPASVADPPHLFQGADLAPWLTWAGVQEVSLPPLPPHHALCAEVSWSQTSLVARAWRPRASSHACFPQIGIRGPG